MAAYSVNRRLLENGIRMAPGADKLQNGRLFLHEHGYVSFAGVAIGLAGALELKLFLQTCTFAIPPVDAPSLVSSVVLLTAAAAAATLISTLRALKSEPSHLLKHD